MKKLIALLLVPVVLVLAAAALAPKLAPEARLHAEALSVLEAATGLPVAIEGEVRFEVLPWPALEISGLTVGPSEGSGLAVPQARIVLELMPLLTGTARADHVELDTPELTLAQRLADEDALAPLLLRLAVTPVAGEMRVSGGRIRVIDSQGDLAAEAGFDGRLRWRGGSSAAVVGRVLWRGEPIDVDATFSQIAALIEGRGLKVSASASAPPGTLAYEGTLGFSGGVSAAGTVKIAANSVRRTLQWLGADAPTEGGFGRFALSADLAANGPSIALSRARLELDGNVSEGGFNVRVENGRAQVQGSLAADTLDLSPYGQVSLAGPEGTDWSREPIDLSRFRLLDLDLRLSAAELRVSGTHLQRLAASAVMRGGRLSLAIGEAEGWQGIFRASAQIAPAATATTFADRATGAEIRVELACEDVTLARALADLFRVQRLEGTGSFRVAASGTGDSIAEILRGLDGSFEITGANGALVGVDAMRILTRLAQRPLSGVGSLRGGRTAFDSFSADATIRGGVAELASLALDSSRIAVRMNGTSVLATGDLDLAGTAELKDSSAGAAFALPFVVKGDWDEPDLLPDTQSLIRRSGAARPLFGSRLESSGLLGPTP